MTQGGIALLCVPLIGQSHQEVRLDNCWTINSPHFLIWKTIYQAFVFSEGGNAEKFPDEWDIQFLGNIVASQLASGTPADFLIKRYVL